MRSRRAGIFFTLLGMTMYDISKLPRQYESHKPNALARRDQIIKLLGF